MKKILTILGLCLGLTTIAIAEEKEKELHKLLNIHL